MIGIISGLLPFAMTTHAAITLDGSMGPKKVLTGPNYTIGENLGTLKGDNLFESFGKFDLLAGESATFTGKAGIENIIGRVTGGSLSSIDGLIRCTIDGADLFLLNPYGVMFGPNASLDVKGSFHVSTADYLKFSDGGRFYADLAKSSVLSVASPEAFGFLSSNPAGISIKGSTLQVGSGYTLSVVGGNIDISGGNLYAPGGRINLVSVASPGEVVFNAPDMGVGSFGSLGNITMSNGAAVSTGGTAGGTVFIRGGQLKITSTADSLSEIDSTTLGNSNGSAVGIDINLRDKLILYGGQIFALTYGAGRTGDIKISAGSVQVGGDPINSTNTGIGNFSVASGRCGNVEITAGSLLVNDGAYVENYVTGAGAGGNIGLNVGNLQLQNGSVIFAGSGGQGKGGNLKVSANDVLLSGNSSVGALTSATNDGGHLGVATKTLEILDGAYLFSITSGTGNGGNVDVKADSIFIQGSSTPNIFTGIIASSTNSGKGGNINVVSSGDLQMTNYADLQASTFGTGDCGSITVRTGSLEVMDASRIISNAIYGPGIGKAGNIYVTSKNILMSGLQHSTDPFGADATGIFGENQDGPGGLVSITSNSLVITNRAGISTSSYGKGLGGNVNINASDLQLLNGSQIIAGAFGSGNGGEVNITAGRLLISGVNPEPFVSSFYGGEQLAISSIGSQAALSGGNAGSVNITAGNLQLVDGGQISTTTFGAGNGGDISVKAGTTFISGTNTALKQFLMAQGTDATSADNAASSSIWANTNTFYLGDKASGNAGNVSIQSGMLQLQDHGLISAGTNGPGAGGNITIESADVQLTNGALITAESSGSGNAGSISIAAGDTFIMRNSSVITEAAMSDGGNISISAGNMFRLIDSTISTSVNGGPGTVGGNIIIDPDFLILQNSKIIAEAYEGRGGNIQITAGLYLADPNSIVDASSALGINGAVDIRAPIADLSGMVTPLPSEFVSASELLKESCEVRARSGKKTSSFVIRGRDGLPVEPGGFLPSPSSWE
jgi:filamentous hemagglutinin family protein